MPSKAGSPCAGGCSNTHTKILSFPQTLQLRQTNYRQEKHGGAAKKRNLPQAKEQQKWRQKFNSLIASPAFGSLHCALSLCPCPPVQLWDFRWDALGEGYSAEIQGGGDGERGLRKAGREEPVPRGALLLLQAIKLGCIIPYPLPSPPNPKEVLAIQATVQKNRAWFSGEEFELIPPRGWGKKKKSHVLDRQCNVLWHPCSIFPSAWSWVPRPEAHMKLKGETISFLFLLFSRSHWCKVNKAQQQGVIAGESLLPAADQARKHLPDTGNRHHLLFCCHLLKGWGDFTKCNAMC